MPRPRLHYLTEADKQFVHEQTLRVLSEVGVAYNTPTLTGLLAEAGAIVDAETLTARAAVGPHRALPQDRAPATSCWRVATQPTIAA